MDPRTVYVLVGFILTGWVFGFGQNSTFCEQRYREKQRYRDTYIEPYFVNVCQVNNGSLSKVGEVIILDPAGAPLEQGIKCNCYMSFDIRQQYMKITTFIVDDGTHNAEFKIDGSVYNNVVKMGSLNITSETTIQFRQGNHDHSPNVCIGISNADTKRGNLTIRCKAFEKELREAITTKTQTTPTPTRSRSENTPPYAIPETTPTPSISETIPTNSMPETTPIHPLPSTTQKHSILETNQTHSMSETTPTHSVPNTIPTLSMPGTNSTQSTHAGKDGSMNVVTVILCTNIGVILLVCITVCCVVRRKRSSNKKMSKDPKPIDKRMGDSTAPSGESTEESSASAQGNCNTRKTYSIMSSEYAYVDHCDVTASAEVNFNQPTEIDVYNHLHEAQPSPNSDNVYSTPCVYNTTSQKSDAMPQLGLIKKPAESDVYNHLNEIRPRLHTDNIYNATNVQEPGASSSQYDNVEIVKLQHHAKPDSDYNVLSFP